VTLELKFGETTMPNPRYDTPYDMEYLGFGVQFRTLDTTLKTQLMGHKYRTRIYWNGLTKDERATVLSAFVSLLSTASVVTFPDTSTLTVQSIIGSWSEQVWYSPWAKIGYYDVSFQVEEV